jgi:hypothetical protein
MNMLSPPWLNSDASGTPTRQRNRLQAAAHIDRPGRTRDGNFYERGHHILVCFGTEKEVANFEPTLI